MLGCKIFAVCCMHMRKSLMLRCKIFTCTWLKRDAKLFSQSTWVFVRAKCTFRRAKIQPCCCDVFALMITIFSMFEMPTAKIHQATSSVVPKCLLRCSTVEVCSYVGEMSLSWIRSVDWPLKVRKSTVSFFHRFSLGETCWDHVENAYWVGLKSSYLVLHWTDVIKVFELWFALQYGFSAHAEYCHNVMKFICELLPLHCNPVFAQGV